MPRLLIALLVLLLGFALLLSRCPPESVSSVTGVGCRASDGVAYTPSFALTEAELASYLLTDHEVTLLASFEPGALDSLSDRETGIGEVYPFFSFRDTDALRDEVASVMRSIDCLFTQQSDLIDRVPGVRALLEPYGSAPLPPRARQSLLDLFQQQGVIQLSGDHSARGSAKHACVQRDGPFVSSATLTLAPIAWAAVGPSPGPALVAVLDTGIDGGHALLGTSVHDRLCVGLHCPGCSGGACGLSSASPNPARGEGAAGEAACSDATADCIHGTAVSSVISGACAGTAGACNSTESCVPGSLNDAADPGPAVAPAAKLIDMRVVGADDAADGPAVTRHTMLMSLVMLVAAINLDPSLKKHLAAVVIPHEFVREFAGSALFTSTQACADAYPCLARVVELLRRRDVAVVAASGNGGSATGIAAPACLPGVVSVGGTTRNATAGGNRGALLDFVAPGLDVWGASTSKSDCCSPSNDGTSFAAPAVGAALALARSAGERDLETAIEGLCRSGYPRVTGPGGTPSAQPWPMLSKVGSTLYADPAEAPFHRAPRTTCAALDKAPGGGFGGPRQLALDCYPKPIAP